MWPMLVAIALQLRSLAQIEQRILQVTHRAAGSPHAGAGAGLGPSNEQPAGALLMVTGSHPLRSLPLGRQ